MQDSWYFIVNPSAGGDKVKRKWPKLEQALDQANIDYTVTFTEAPKQATQVVIDAIKQGYVRFAVVGGDGSINETINGIFQQQDIPTTECVLAALPWGTGNDWAAYYGLPSSVSGFIEMLNKNNVQAQDIGQAQFAEQGQQRQHYFMNFIGCGFDSYMLSKMGAGQGGRLRYFLFVLACLRSYRSAEFFLHIGGHKHSFKALMLMSCIGRLGGAGMKLAPKAKTDDGLFNVLCIGDMPLHRRIASLMYLFNGKIDEHRAVTTYLNNEMTITANKPVYFQCDGEIVGQLPVTIRSINHSLHLLVP